MLGPFIIAAPTALGTECVREISPQDQNQLATGDTLRSSSANVREKFTPRRAVQQAGQ
jgi:hypothetical protein